MPLREAVAVLVEAVPEVAVLGDEQVQPAWERFLSVADRKKEVTDADLIEICAYVQREIARSA